MMKSKVLAFLVAGMTILGIDHPEAQADYGYCCSSGWSDYCWIAGALLGTAAGTGAGYAAGHNKGSKGKQGPKGDTGPQGEGFVFTLDPVTTDFESAFFNSMNTVTFNLIWSTVNGSVVGGDAPGVTMGPITKATANGIIFRSPLDQSKIVGDYYLTLVIETDSDFDTALGTFGLSVGANPDIPYEVVVGKDPAVSQAWVDGDVTVLKATFGE